MAGGVHSGQVRLKPDLHTPVLHTGPGLHTEPGLTEPGLLGGRVVLTEPARAALARTAPDVQAESNLYTKLDLQTALRPRRRVWGAGFSRTLGVLVAALTVAASAALHAQAQGTLHVIVSLVDGSQRPIPVARHALLISDNPATSSPRRVVTGADGTVDVRLRPGNYTVESDEPVAFDGKAYEWTIDVDVPTGGAATIVLNASNAGIGDAATAGAGAAAPRVSSPSIALQQWKPAVVALWTPTARASGFVFDTRGLVATSASALGGATVVEVQLSATLKVHGQVLVSDTARDVAVVRTAPGAAASVTPLPVPCTAPTTPPVEGDELFALGVPLRAQQDTLSSGEVKQVDAGRLQVDLRVPAGGVGGPVFSEASTLIGISSVLPDESGTRRRLFTVAPRSGLCEVLPAVDAAMSAPPPAATPLPVDSPPLASLEPLKGVAGTRGGDLSPYQLASSDFDLSFITPVMTYAAQHPAADRRTTSRDTHRTLEDEVRTTRAMEFGAWSEYVADVPPVLLVRVTPKMAEGFWRSLARGAAMTQGIQLPPMKSAKAVFSRLQAFCGANEVTPIHRLLVETPVSDSDTFREGLYVFAPGALSARCGTVRLVLYSEKEPSKGESRQVDAAVLTRVDQDMAVVSR